MSEMHVSPQTQNLPFDFGTALQRNLDSDFFFICSFSVSCKREKTSVKREFIQFHQVCLFDYERDFS